MYHTMALLNELSLYAAVQLTLLDVGELRL